MLEELRKYKYIKKSNSELEVDRLIDKISFKLWSESGYNTIYHIGAILQLKTIAEGLKESGRIGRDDILMLIKSFKTMKDTPDEIKNLIDMILDEFDYKEENK